MDPVSVSVVISRPVGEVFAYLADVANHSEFRDHYLVDWHLTREESYGQGAGARFKMPARGNRFPWFDITFAEVDPPRRIVERGRGGKFNRIKTVGIFDLEPAGEGTTRVSYQWESLPALPTDRLIEALSGRRMMKRRIGKAMKRLRSILEEDYGRGARVTIAGGARKPASGFYFDAPYAADNN